MKGFDSHSAGSLPALVSALCIWACMITRFKSVSVVSSVSFTFTVSGEKEHRIVSPADFHLHGKRETTRVERSAWSRKRIKLLH